MAIFRKKYNKILFFLYVLYMKVLIVKYIENISLIGKNLNKNDSIKACNYKTNSYLQYIYGIVEGLFDFIETHAIL